MVQPCYEKVSPAPRPAWDEVAFLHYDDTNPVRTHFVCYCVSGPEGPRRYAVASMSAEDTDFYDYNGAAPEDRGLEPYCIYRVRGSDKVNGYDQDHIIFCLSDKSIEFTGLSFGIREPVPGSSALAVLLDHVQKSGLLR